MIVKVPLAHIRLTDGTTLSLARGEPVPDDADPGSVARLTRFGVIGDPEDTVTAVAGDGSSDVAPVARPRLPKQRGQ